MSEIPEKQIKRLRSLITEAETNLAAAKEMLFSILGDGESISAPRDAVSESPDGKIVEGIFDGQNMIGPDGKVYSVPANYASKSKLVEGDLMKLIIAPDGRSVFKQIGPVERRTAIGKLFARDGKYYVDVAGREYEVLYASVTYFHLREGDEASVIVPADNPDAAWAAIESAI